MAIDMVPVDSSAIKSIGHDPSTGIAYVEFHSGDTHPFGPLTPAEFERFRNAESVGKHFHSHIRAKAIR